MSNNQLKYTILAGLFAVPFVPLAVAGSLFFPFITGKAFIFRLIVEIILACYLVLALRDDSYWPKFSWILGALFTFLVVMGVADIFGENPFKAFWSNYERMEGYITLLHLGAYFLVLGSVLKTEEIWNKLLATSLGASTIMTVYAFFQLAGKITINQGGVRVDGTLGNAGYLGIYMVFHIFFAGLLMVRSREKWQKVLLGVLGFLDLIILYFTATRGAILGLVGGAFITFVYLLFKSNQGDRIRKVAGVGLSALIIFVGLFLAFKNTNFVQESPVLSRFSSLSLAEIETQGRYFVWPMAWQGFLERPILGWGQEGFNFVFNKYYDPRMYNQEPWFDRAHSTPLDWLIAGGALGLLAYLAIIFASLYYLFKTKSDSLKTSEKAIILGLVTAYVFNNLFVFDQISSYILFFTILAYIHSHFSETKIKKITVGAKWQPMVEAGIVIATLVVLYFVIYAPWQQNKSLLAVLKLNSENKVGTIADYAKPLSGYRMGFTESLEHISQTAMTVVGNANTPPALKQELFETVDKAFEKQITKVPNDARYRLFYGLFLSRFGWYGRAVEQFSEAQKLSPRKQQIYFELTSNLLLDNKTVEAVEMAKTAYDLEPANDEAKFIYGLTLLAVGDNLATEILKSIPESKLIFDDRYISILLMLKKFPTIIEIAQKRIALEPTNLQHRITLTAVYLEAGQRGQAIATLEEMIRIDPSFKERGDYYINEIKAGRNP